MASPLLLEQTDLGQILIPAGPGHAARTDAARFGPNQTIRFGQAVARRSTDGLMYAYSSAALTAPANLAVATAAGGTKAVGAYRAVVTAVYGNGESAASAEVTGTTTSGNQTLAWTWNAVPGATGYNLYETAVGGSAGAETLLTFVPVPAPNTYAGNPTNVTVTFTDDGTLAPGTKAAPTGATAAPTDGTQVCLGVSEYSFVTDAYGNAYTVFSTVPGSPAQAVPSTRVTPDSTMPYFYTGNFDPRDLTGIDATAMAQLNARPLASGIIHIG